MKLDQTCHVILSTISIKGGNVFRSLIMGLLFSHPSPSPPSPSSLSSLPLTNPSSGNPTFTVTLHISSSEVGEKVDRGEEEGGEGEGERSGKVGSGHRDDVEPSRSEKGRGKGKEEESEVEEEEGEGEEEKGCVLVKCVGRLRVVCISDTHMIHGHLHIPPGDVLIHSGDFSNYKYAYIGK